MVAWLLALAVLALAASTGQAHADGKVARAKGCGDTMFVSTSRGLSLLERIGGGEVAEKDALVGNVDDLGRASLFDSTSGLSLSVLVKEHRLGPGEYSDRVAALCHAVGATRPVGATVLRASGCGNKVFLSSAAGFVVADRMGSFLVEGDSLMGAFTRAGVTTAQNLRQNAPLMLDVLDFGLSKSALGSKMKAACR